MIRFSANLGFLWNTLPLPDAIHAAKRAGFEAVECHWPYATPSSEVKNALNETGLKMLGLNTQRGNVASGDNGVAALVDREQEARAFIDEAIAYANEIDCLNIHVMAGFTDHGEHAENCFRENLTYACEQAAKSDKVILIEPLNKYDAPGYHLSTLETALETQRAVAKHNLKIMFDCYHLQIMGGDLIRRLSSCLKNVGHIQIAAVPDRGEPDNGEINYPWLLKEIDDLGWEGFIGAEYKPRTSVEDGLTWLSAYRRT